MLIPNKHQDLSKSILVIGADILFYTKKGDYILEDLFQIIKKERKIGLDVFLDSVTFLWSTNAISYKSNVIKCKIK